MRGGRGKEREYKRRRQHQSAVAGPKRYIGGETASNIPQPYTRVSTVLVTLTVSTRQRDVHAPAQWWEFPTMMPANKLTVHEHRRVVVCVERVVRVVVTVAIWSLER